MSADRAGWWRDYIGDDLSPEVRAEVAERLAVTEPSRYARTVDHIRELDAQARSSQTAIGLDLRTGWDTWEPITAISGPVDGAYRVRSATGDVDRADAQDFRFRGER